MVQKTLQFSEEESRRAENKTQQVLRMLQEGPVSSVELLTVTHRFSACIHRLKERGYHIVVEKLEDGTSNHFLMAYTPLVEVTNEMKEQYYRTAHWSVKRRERMSFDSFQCRHCMATAELQVHHWKYDLFNEAIHDLVTLCKDCHTRIHEYESVSTHFPRFVTQDIADKLNGVCVVTTPTNWWAF